MTLEKQLESLADLGLQMNPGITVDDLLYSYERIEYESDPFELILFIFGNEVERETWGRQFCERAWTFDTECIDSTGSYMRIAEKFCRVAGMPTLFKHIEDFVDLAKGKAWLKYWVDGNERFYTIPVDNDWADPATVGSIMKDIERHGNRFYGKLDGQSTTWFYLNHETAEALNRLANGALSPNE
jgi:hypothetical protein